MILKTGAVDMIGIDFYQTDLAKLPKNFSFDIIAGIVDGRNSLLEDEQVLKKFVDRMISHTKAPAIYLSNNCELEFLPEVVARRKLEILGKLKAKYNKTLNSKL